MAKKPATGSKSFSEALDFLSPLIASKGTLMETHATLINNFMVMRSQEMAAAHPIEESLRLTVEATPLQQAVKRLTGALVIASDATSLSLRAGRLSVTLATLGEDALAPVAPDPALAPLTADFVAAVRLALPLISETGTRVVDYAMLNEGASIVASYRGYCILQYHHGLDMPPGMVLPWKFCNTLAKCKLKPVAFGYSGESFTVHFENGAWIKTQLVVYGYPDAIAILDRTNFNTVERINAMFFDAVKAVKSFNEDGHIEISRNHVRALGTAVDAAHEIAPVGIPEGESIKLNAEVLTMLQDCISEFSFSPDGLAHSFYGENCRGSIARLK